MNDKALTKIQVVVVSVIIVVAAIAGGVYYVFFSSRPAREEIVIGWSMCLTGAMAGLGKECHQGYLYAIDDINKNGGVYITEFGRKLPLRAIFYDDASDPEKARLNYERLISVDKVDFILSSHGTPNTAVAISIAEKYKIPLVAGTSAALAFFQKGYKYYFSVFMTAEDQARVFFELMETVPSELRPRTAVIWEESTDLGKDHADAFENASKEHGITLLFREKYLPNQADYSSLILKTKEAKPDVVFAIPSPADGVTFVRQSKELGLKVKMLFLERASAATTMWEILGKDAEGLINVQNWCWNLPTPGNKEIVERYRQEKGVLPSSVLGPAYASVQVLVAAIEKAGTLEHEQVRKALTEIKVENTVIGPVEFLPDGRIRAIMNVLQWQNGSQIIVYPPEYATGKFIYPMPAFSEG